MKDIEKRKSRIEFLSTVDHALSEKVYALVNTVLMIIIGIATVMFATDQILLSFYFTEEKQFIMNLMFYVNIVCILIILVVYIAYILYTNIYTKGSKYLRSQILEEYEKLGAILPIDKERLKKLIKKLK